MDVDQPGDCVLSSVISMLQQIVGRQTPEVRVSTQQYEKWHEDFLFETLQFDTRYGQSFCNKFDITDYILYYMRDIKRADEHIRKHYLR